MPNNTVCVLAFFHSYSFGRSAALAGCRGVYITDSVLADLGICSSCAFGNNELVVS